MLENRPSILILHRIHNLPQGNHGTITQENALSHVRTVLTNPNHTLELLSGHILDNSRMLAVPHISESHLT